jgi:cyanophycinase-like exopeptidase
MSGREVMMDAMSLLVVMGSGETAPTMVKAHRAVMTRSGIEPPAGTAHPAQAVQAVFLDTPFGFQMNADDLVAKTQQYFADSVGVPVSVAGWRHRDIPSTDQEKTLAQLAQARWVFAGPGSPTYALRQWAGTALPGALLDVAARGGTLVFGSAAACTVGTHAIPVYEIYKVGTEPRWEPGLNLLGTLTGVQAVVIPHFNNAEGGQYDTRYCYLGEPRLVAMEAQLPDRVGVLGVDEHTALIIDLDAGTAQVSGNGLVTLRPRGAPVRTLLDGEQIALSEMSAVLSGEHLDSHGAIHRAVDEAAEDLARPPEPAATSLAAHAEQARLAFDAALAGRDVTGCVTAILALEEAIHAWSADTLQSDETATARRQLRSLVVRLGELAERGARDPAAVVQPYVDALLDLRARARTGRDFSTADQIRDQLIDSGVEVRDTPGGVTWSLAQDGG